MSIIQIATKSSKSSAEECTNIQLPRIQKQLKNVRAHQHPRYLNYQNEEIKARGTKNMSMIAYVNHEPEIVSKESLKDSKNGDNPKD